MKSKGILISCQHCHYNFSICTSCYRGHIYCSNSCRDDARTIQQRSAKKRYAESIAGKKSQYLRNRRYLDKKDKEKNIKKNVTDHSSINEQDKLEPESVGTDQEPGVTKKHQLTGQKCCICHIPIDFLYPSLEDYLIYGRSEGG